MRAANFYQGKLNQSRQERNESPLIKIRKFNNYIKSVTISDALDSTQGGREVGGARVLDLCGGSGGDLAKFSHANISHLTLVDISQTSVEEANRRYKEGEYRYYMESHVGNAFDFAWMKQILHDGQEESKQHSFDLINCQFALHYAFDNVSTITQVFQIFDWALKPGGKVVATFINASEVMARLESSELWKTPHFCIQKQKEGYLFSMGEAVVNVLEFPVYQGQVEEMCHSHNLNVTTWVPFLQVLNKSLHNPTHLDFWKRLRFSKEDVAEVILENLYIAMLLTKKEIDT